MTSRRYGRRSLETSNEDKVLFPELGLTKGGLIDYYERAADALLPHLAGRPLVLQRFPDGIEGEGFYQKQVPESFPGWIRRVRVEVLSRREPQELVVCDRKATLAYLANQACVALHPWLSRADALDRPDLLLVDLDPADGDFEPVRRAALQVRALLEDELGLVAFAKLTGSRGVHVVVPLRGAGDFDEVRAFARAAMGLLAARHPGALTTEVRKAARRGRLYLDVGRNAYAQTAVAPWSVRALPGAPVAAPVGWGPLGRGEVGARDYTVANVFRRTARRADPWRGFRRHARSLRAPAARLAELRAREGLGDGA